MADELSRDDLRRREAAFDRYLSAAAQGRLARPDPARDQDLEEQLAATVRRVHALAGHPLPDPDRADRLWRTLMTGYAPTAPLPLAPSLPRPLDGHRRTARPLARPIPRTRRTSSRISSGVSFVATVALVAIVLGMIFFIYHNGQNVAVPLVQETPTVVATQTAPATGDWTTVRGNPARTGATDQPGPTGQFGVLWTFKAPDSINAPMVAGDTVYVASNAGIVYAVDARTGRQRWAFDLGSVPQDLTVYAFPTVGQSLVYVAATSGTMYALNRGDGTVRWSFQAAGQVSASPALVGDTLYFADSGGAVYALDAATGTVRWTATIGQTSFSLPVVADGIVYQSDGSGGLHAFDAATGATLWSKTFGGNVRAPAVVGGYAYFSCDDGTFYAVDAKTGTERWHYTPASGTTAYSPAVGGGSVVTNVEGVGTVALDAETGAQIWQVPFEASSNPPVIASGVVYVADGTSQVLAFDLATGQPVGGATVANVPGIPAISGGVLYVADFDGTLTAFVTGSATPVSQAAVAPTTPAQPSPTPAPAGVQAVHLWTDHVGKEAVSNIEFTPDGKVWVQDYGGIAWIFDRDGNLLDKWGTPGSGPGELTFKIAGEPSWYGDVAFAPDGSFFIAECGNSRVEKFDAQRNLVLSIGTRGRGDGQFLCPSGVAVAADGDIFVADLRRNDIQRFAPDGTFRGNLGTFASPVDLTLDGSGNLVFAEQDADHILVIAPDGTSVLSFGTPGTTPGHLFSPDRIAIDEAGNFYVGDNSNHVSVFDPTGVFLGTVGSEGTSDGQFGQGLTAVGYGGNGFLYAADLGDDGSGTFRVQKFKVTVTAPPPATPTP
jgi:outer membrane protein assembly factor BamB